MRHIELIMGPYGYEKRSVDDLPEPFAPVWGKFPTIPFAIESLAPEFREALGDDIVYYGSFDTYFFVFSVSSLGMQNTFILIHVSSLIGMYVGQLVPKVRQLVYHIPNDKLVKKQLDIS